MKVDPQIFSFLRDLAANNNREWFNANKERYTLAREAFTSLTEEFIAAVCAADATIEMQKAKDCLYRIYRDVRFSADKRPYKTNMSCYVAPGGKNSRLPGYYLSVEPGGETVMGGGIYCPDKEDTARIRREICNFPEDIIAAVENRDFARRMTMWDWNPLKTFPKGYETGFEGDKYLKYRTWSSAVKYSDAECCSDAFDSLVRTDLRLAQPLNAFLSRALCAPDEEEVDF